MVSGLSEPEGVAVDATGDVFVATLSTGELLEVPAGATTPVPVATGLSEPTGVAVAATSTAPPAETPEVPWAPLLPLSAVGLGGVVLWLRRHGARRAV